MKILSLGKISISEKHPVVLVAEFSDGHMGSLEHAKKLVNAAKKAGADIVKFQMHFPDDEMVAGVKMWAGDLQKILKKSWFSPEKHATIMRYCKEIGIQYLCTPFSPKAVDVLHTLGVSGFKTGSGEIYNLPFQRKLAQISSKTGKPVFISTGMCTMKELEETISIHKKEGSNFLLMNCTSEYPVKNYANVRLNLITKLRKKFKVYIGQSDHTTDNYTSFAAVVLGARVIEKHFTLNRKGDFPDDFMSLDPGMFKELADGVRKIEASLKDKGQEKKVTPAEKKIRAWAFHSVVSDIDLKKDDKIRLGNVRPARPGWGISARYLDPLYSKKLIGKKVRKNIPKNTVVRWRDLQ